MWQEDMKRRESNETHRLAVLRYKFVLLQLIFVLLNICEGVWFLELAIRCSGKRGSISSVWFPRALSSTCHLRKRMTNMTAVCVKRDTWAYRSHSYRAVPKVWHFLRHAGRSTRVKSLEEEMVERHEGTLCSKAADNQEVVRFASKPRHHILFFSSPNI